MFWPDAVFSATLRVVLVPSVKVGAVLVEAVVVSSLSEALEVPTALMAETR